MTHSIARTAGRAALAGLLLALSGIAAADSDHGRGDGFRGRGGRDHDFRQREFRDRPIAGGRVFEHRTSDHRDDRRYRHVLPSLPSRHEIVMHHGSRYYFGGGLWYRGDRPGRFVVVAPPFGIVVPMLPPLTTTIATGSALYYLSNNTYYQRGTSGYVVVEPPPSNVVTAPAQVASADQIYAYPREGQDTERQAADRAGCDDWAVGQTGYDPRFAGTAGDTMAMQNRDAHRRALTACLDGRGYTVR